MRLFTRMRQALSRLAPSRALRSHLISGWVSGRFPQSLRGGALRRQRDYFLYVPGGVRRRDRVPLFLMLHGCSQDARTLAQGSRMNELAEEHRFMVLYPQQSLHANPFRCWNWFEPRIGRGAGEAAAIVALVNAVARRYPIDRSRIYVAGISAGGAMTTILALCYGKLFAACAIVAGVMYGAAESALTGARAMRQGASVLPERIAEEAARRASRKASFVPALVIQGTDDSVVHPLNAEQIVRGACENLRSRAIMLDYAPVAVDPENKGSHRRVGLQRFHARRRCLSADPLAGCHGRLLKSMCTARSRSLWANERYN